jgi:molybdopterin-guanine dinucleotide biosynthesis protein B
VVCIVGRKNAGKTELTVALAAEFHRRGRRVMTVKHGHGFQLDQPGRDSWRHRHEGGAIRTVMAGPSDFAVVGGWPGGEEMALADLVHRFLSDADIVLAEGFKRSPEPKLEIFREVTDSAPLVTELPDLAEKTLALVTDMEDPGFRGRVFDLGDDGYVAKVADFLDQALLEAGN